MRARLSGIAVIFALLLFVDSTARADGDSGDEQQYDSQAVQNRLYRSDHEVSVHFGMLPLDAFTKGITLSGAYTLHFADLFGWEVVHFYHSFPSDTDLKKDLGVFNLAPTPFEVVENFVTSSLVVKPLYWKGAFLNDTVLYGELMFVVGGGYGWFTQSNRACIDLGVAVRFYTNEWLSFRVDIREVAFFNDTVFSNFNLHHEIWGGLGASISF